MNKEMTRRAALRNGALLASALAGAGTVSSVPVAASGAETFVFPVTNLTIPASENTCTNEEVVVDGWRRVTVKQDPSTGQFHLTVVIHGTGEGSESGTEYRYNWRFTETVPRGGGTFTTRLSGVLVSEGPAQNMVFDFLVHVTVNANGEVTAVTFDPLFPVRCTGTVETV